MGASMQTPSDREIAENAARLGRSAALIVVMFATGIIGYRLVGGPTTNLLDATYMTMITLTTVGYGEVIDLSTNPAGRVFTIMLLFTGAGSFVYFFSNLTAFIVEGNLDRYLWRRRMKLSIAALKNHIIVCGVGATGRKVIEELLATQRPFVVVDNDEQKARDLAEELDTEFPLIVGDATDDDFLIEAGIERASGVIATVRNDRDNLIITVSAKMLKNDLRVIARCIDEKMVKKARQAGAASVISPNAIGGMRMVSEMIRPQAVTFLDIMLRDKDQNLRIEDFLVTEGHALAHTHVGSLREQRTAGMLVVAIKRPDDSWVFNPEDAFVLEPGMSVVYMGGPDARLELEALLDDDEDDEEDDAE
jgi:voltage-gated potassium channel